MTRQRFESLVAEAIMLIPRRFRREMKNLAVIVEDEPSDDLLDQMEIEPPDTLLGLYQGTPLPERSAGHGNTLPDVITIFQGPLSERARDRDDLAAEVRVTVLHEVGHYFGMDDARLHELGWA